MEIYQQLTADLIADLLLPECHEQEVKPGTRNTVGKIMIGGRSSYSTDSLSVLRRGIEVAPENRVGFFSRSKRKRWSILSAKDARSPDGLRSRPLTNSSSFSNSSLPSPTSLLWINFKLLKSKGTAAVDNRARLPHY